MKNQKKLSNEEINYSQPSQVLRYTFWWTTGRAVFNIHVLCVHCLTRLVMLVGKSSRVELDQMSLQWSHIEKFWSFLGYLAHPVSLHTWAHLCVCSWTLSLMNVNGGGWLVVHQNAAFFDFVIKNWEVSTLWKFNRFFFRKTRLFDNFLKKRIIWNRLNTILLVETIVE